MPVSPEELCETVLLRGEFLDELVGVHRRKPALADELSVSRSTVDRALRQLEQAGLVTRVDGEFTATLPGRLAAKTYGEYREDVGTIAETSDLLCNLDPECNVSRRMLRGADVMVAQQPAPYRPATELKSYVHGASRVLGLSRSITNSSTSDLLAARVKEGMEYHVVYDTTLAQFLSRGRGKERAEMVETGHFEAYATDGLPYGLFIFEREDQTVVALVIYDDTDDLRGVFLNDTEEAIEWAREVWHSVRETAMPITETFAESTAADERSAALADDGGDGRED
jgi:predicted transcriptional regulator